MAATTITATAVSSSHPALAEALTILTTDEILEELDLVEDWLADHPAPARVTHGQRGRQTRHQARLRAELERRGEGLRCAACGCPSGPHGPECPCGD